MTFSRFPALLAYLMAAVLALAVPQNAQAAYPCPAGPGPGEVQVGVSQGGNGVASVPMCERAGGGSGGGGVVYSSVHGSIAWHPDVDDVWMSGNWEGNAAAWASEEALSACNAAMGGGCSSTGTWSNSVRAIARDRNGGLWDGWGAGSGKAKQDALTACRQKQPLPCEIIGTFSSSKRRHSPNLTTARKLYAVGAWVQGSDGYDSRLYIASGHRTGEAAINAAKDACTKATGRACEITVYVGNGFIQTYGLDDADHGAQTETTQKRAVEAAQAFCKGRKSRCRLETIYDSRKPGLFVHQFGSATGG